MEKDEVGAAGENSLGHAEAHLNINASDTIEQEYRFCK
jgi:hypothetical protein